ncbi:hypothetical protein ALC53_08188 [Atta colombica]|uniref:Uncharacterized protein n=1 Tax=Atta colombica TaxID=520822 RepID=A0A195BB23_9HYME|nr:hypothetical protein ALC53_08188 [Atta colombica]
MEQKPNNLLQINTTTILAGTAVFVNSSRFCNIASRTKVNPVEIQKQITLNPISRNISICSCSLGPIKLSKLDNLIDIDIWMRIDLFRYTLFTIQITTNKYSILADDLASKKSALTSSMSSFLILVLSLTFAAKAAGVKSCTTYLRVVFVPSSPRLDRASSSICSPSVTALSFTICSISCLEYGRVLIIRRRSNRSRGMPCGEIISSVPLISQRPRFVAKITIGAIALSNARCR